MKKLMTFLAAALGSASVGTAADTALASTSVNEFGVDLHQRMAKGDGNLCISPFSIQAALAMTYAGADGTTAEEMAKVLHYPTGDAIHSSFGALLKALDDAETKTVARAKQAKSYGGPSEPLTLRVANRLFGQTGYQFKAPFRSLLKDTYGAPLEEIDFGASERSTKHINAWVEDQTRKRIRNLISPGVLGAASRLVLVNAVYLKAPWAAEFSKIATKPEPFHVRGGEPQQVPAMIRKGHYGYAKRGGYRVVTIPYTGDDVQFVAWIPDAAEGLPQVEKELSAKALAECARLESAEIILHLPKFKLEPPSLALGKELQGMGMKAAFDVPQGTVNFEKMAPLSTGV